MADRFLMRLMGLIAAGVLILAVLWILPPETGEIAAAALAHQTASDTSTATAGIDLAGSNMASSNRAGSNRAGSSSAAAILVSTGANPPAATDGAKLAADEDTISHRLSLVTARVDGRVAPAVTTSPASQTRVLRRGDPVAKGQLLATIWSPRLGEMKSRYLAAALRLMIDEAALQHLSEAHAADSELAASREHCQTARRGLEHAQEALREIQFNEEEIAALTVGAARALGGQGDFSRGANWAEIELRAPRSGILVHAGAVPGATVRRGSVLFQIGDQSQVAAHDGR